MARPSRKLENELRGKGFHLVAGVDEAGRGPLAGPVVAAAVIFPSEYKNAEIDNSKKLSEKKREKLLCDIERAALSIGIGIVDADMIDKINILKATLLAMQTAVENLSPRPDFLLIDGRDRLRIPIPQKAIIRGDSLCFSVAAASIVAKVTRDRIMNEYHITYPDYGFTRHKGYGTSQHLQKILKHGPSPIHRRSYGPVSAAPQTEIRLDIRKVNT